MSFYNPYSKYPDVGQGVGDLMGQLLQFMLMKKYFGQGQQPGATAGMGARAGGVMPPQMGPQMPQMGGPTANMTGQAGQMDPQILAYLRMLGLI